MKVYEHFPFNYREQSWTVPEGVTSAYFECWGAAGGMSSGFHTAAGSRVVVGGSAPNTTDFTNAPGAEGALGKSYSNNAGYAAGLKNVTPGEVYYVYVGGNGGPGFSSIMAYDGAYYTTCNGGFGGFNGGGNGGAGALVHQNLYNADTTHVNFTGIGIPNAATSGQLWHDTATETVKKCNHTYTAGNGQSSYWTMVTAKHSYSVGGSGGGGGGATDIRSGGNAVGNRILVAGGSGGAGSTWHTTGPTSWGLQRVPTTPVPPFGADTTDATGPDDSWATAINYFAGGMGCGGLGGATGPAPTTSDVTRGGGNITVGGDGTPGTMRHADGAPFTPATASAGGGGGNASGGTRGVGNGSPGSWAQGGAGGYASGGDDYWSDGGGGGGGGFYGGGGGGQGFGPVGGAGAGGGGGSNYASLAFTQTVLVGGARPPAAAPGKINGGNGLGGYARISYTAAPSAVWTTIPRATEEDGTFDATFTFSPGVAGGSGISHYVVGTATDPTATFPTTQQTIMVSDPTETVFTHEFSAPAASTNEAFFVQVVDVDGDSSEWVKATVGGVAATVNTGAVITAPAVNAHFAGGAITWTPGDQSPEVAYRIGWSGIDPTTGRPKSFQSGWKPGGSRVNHMLDPGFLRSGSWSGMVTDTTYPGASGANGSIAWPASVTDGSAVSVSETINTLRPNTAYRLSLDVASNLANDTRPYILQALDDTGAIATVPLNFSAMGAGVFTTATLSFTPHTQNVHFAIVPSSLDGGTDPTQAIMGDTDIGQITYLRNGIVELAYGSGQNLIPNDATTQSIVGWGPVVGGVATVTGTYKGQSAVEVTVTATTPYAGASIYSTAPVVYNAAGQTRIALTAEVALQPTTTATAVLLAVYDSAGGWVSNVIGVGTAAGQVPADGNYHQVQWSTALAGNSNLIAVAVEAYNAAGFATTEPPLWFRDVHFTYAPVVPPAQSYFDGSTPGAAWSGTANDSASTMAGTDVTTDTLPNPGTLIDSEVFLDTLSIPGVVAGQDAVRTTQVIAANPVVPTAPTVNLTADSTTGFVVLNVNAADAAAAAAAKTVSFDILRDGVRIATGLTPDLTSRLATYYDIPASNTTVTYTVRAISAGNGFADTTTGSLTLVG